MLNQIDFYMNKSRFNFAKSVKNWLTLIVKV